MLSTRYAGWTSDTRHPGRRAIARPALLGHFRGSYRSFELRRHLYALIVVIWLVAGARWWGSMPPPMRRLRPKVYAIAYK
jgi:hypothetical protein